MAQYLGFFFQEIDCYVGVALENACLGAYFSSIWRLVVRLATQPFSNSMRALAMSGVSLITRAPLAESVFTGDLRVQYGVDVVIS